MVGAWLARAIYIIEKQLVGRTRLEQSRQQKQRIEVGARENVLVFLIYRRVSWIKPIR
jgi:hypothetical protein